MKNEKTGTRLAITNIDPAPESHLPILTTAKWRLSSPNSFFNLLKLLTIPVQGPAHSWKTSTTVDTNKSMLKICAPD